MEPEISNLTLEKLHEFEPLSKETLMFCQGYPTLFYHWEIGYPLV
jgi:hypothetical protein